MRQGAMGKGTMHQMIARMAFIVSGYAINIAMVYMLGDPVSYGLLGIVINMTNIARVLSRRACRKRPRSSSPTTTRI